MLNLSPEVEANCKRMFNGLWSQYFTRSEMSLLLAVFFQNNREVQSLLEQLGGTIEDVAEFRQAMKEYAEAHQCKVSPSSTMPSVSSTPSTPPDSTSSDKEAGKPPSTPSPA